MGDGGKTTPTKCLTKNAKLARLVPVSAIGRGVCVPKATLRYSPVPQFGTSLAFL